MNNGYIKLSRCTLDNPIVMKSPEHLTIWIYLLLNATHSNYDVIYEGQRKTLKSGQLITGRKLISKALKINESKVQRILKTFEIEQQIEQQTNPRCRLISILNWGKWQGSEQQTEQQLNNKRTLNKNVKKIKNNTYTSEFEEFYSLYPKNVGKKPAFTKYKQVLKKISHIDLITALKKQIDAGVWNIDKQFIPLAATWLNKERWADEIEDLRPAKKTTKAVFRQTKTGLFIAYCSKCNKKQYPNEYQLKQDGCCGVELSPIPIEKKMDNGFTDLQAENFLKEIEKRVTA
jgi:hypothetical protein